MRTVIRWVVVVVLLAHGLIHLLGAAKGFGWATVAALSSPTSAAGGALWLAASLLVLLAAALLGARAPRWWAVGAVAAVVSQVAIISAWQDARAGTAATVLMLVAAGQGYAAHGPGSYRAEYRRRLAATANAAPAAVVTEADLAGLPNPLATYVRRSGAVGRPRVVGFSARISGRIRAGAATPWMPFTGAQANTYAPQLTRLFFMDATRGGLPVDVLHVFVDASASMRVKACSLVPMVNATGPAMDQSETVTVFNDLCVLAPAALIDADVRWQAVDDRHVRGTFTHGMHTVSAELVFDDGDLVDFVSDDRLRASGDGKEFTPQRWSTPVGAYREFDGRRVATQGEARWHGPAPEGDFAYLEVTVEDIVYNATAEGGFDPR